MEKKQLDFNAPLLSVRRLSSTLASSNRDTKAINGSALPNRRHTMVSVRSDYNLEQVTEPVAVPFLWEHTPGRAKSRSGPLPQSKPLDRFFDKEMEDQNVVRTKAQVSNSNSNLMILEPSDWENGGDNDEAYSDALDTLSPASFSLHCSVSGLSGSDGLDTKPSGTFSTDAQTRDFMLSRFLPAAKAMTLETPHYVSRKQSLTLSREQPREVKKMVIDDKKLYVREYATRIIPYVEQGKREESESEEGDHDHSVTVLAKSRGFLPRLRSSLCLLNPMPGMKLRSQSPKASTCEVRKQKKSYSGPLSHVIDKHTLEANCNGKMDFGMKSKQMHYPIRQSYSGELPMTTRSSPYRNSRIGGKSPHQNEKPASPLHQAIKFIGIPKIAKNFKTDRSNKEYAEGHKNEGGQGLISPVVEKTLYIDSINTVQYSNFRSNSSQNKGKIEPESREVNVLKSSIVKAEVTGYSNGNSPSYSDISYIKGRAESRRSSNVSPSRSNLNPPLPKCPSESWLWRTLPSVPSRSSSPHSRKVAQTTTSTGTKWENIVKTSYLHHDHVRYSEELIANGRKKTRT